jgi:hypothetical protein
MKRLFVLLVLAFPSVAAARVVMTPTIPRTCREGESWDKVTAKLVSITSTNFRVPGLYLYRHIGKKWVIAGMHEMSGAFEVFGFSNPTIHKRNSYRFDVGVIDEASSDGGRAIVKQSISVLCTGDSYFCAYLVTSCDYFVDGRARETFRGKLTIKGGTARVAGDRTRSGTYCTAPEEIVLVTGEPDEI